MNFNLSGVVYDGWDILTVFLAFCIFFSLAIIWMSRQLVKADFKRKLKSSQRINELESQVKELKEKEIKIREAILAIIEDKPVKDEDLNKH